MWPLVTSSSHLSFADAKFWLQWGVNQWGGKLEILQRNPFFSQFLSLLSAKLSFFGAQRFSQVSHRYVSQKAAAIYLAKGAPTNNCQRLKVGDGQPLSLQPCEVSFPLLRLVYNPPLLLLRILFLPQLLLQPSPPEASHWLKRRLHAFAHHWTVIFSDPFGETVAALRLQSSRL